MITALAMLITALIVGYVGHLCVRQAEEERDEARAERDVARADVARLALFDRKRGVR